MLEDQIGYLASNLFWPLTRRRFEGLRLFHDGDAISTVANVWLSLTLRLLSPNRARDVPLIATRPFLDFAVLLDLSSLSRESVLVFVFVLVLAGVGQAELILPYIVQLAVVFFIRYAQRLKARLPRIGQDLRERALALNERFIEGRRSGLGDLDVDGLYVAQGL